MIKPLLLNLFTSNIAFDNIVTYRRLLLINFIFLIAFVVTIIFSGINYTKDNFLMGTINIISSIVCILILVYLRKSKNIALSGLLATLTVMGFFILFIVINQANHLGIIWTVLVPLLTIYINGKKKGLYLSLAFYLVEFILAYLGIGVWNQGLWDISDFIRFVIASLLLTFIIYSNEIAIEHSNTQLLIAQENEKQYLEALLIQQSKMASMGEMMAAITHQWKQPISTMNATLTSMEFLRLSGDEIKDIDENILLLKEQLHYMNETSNDFKDFFKPDKKKQTFKLQEVIDKIQSLFGKQYKLHKIDVHSTVIHDVEIHSYFNEYCQVLINLVNNAKDSIISTNAVNKTIHITIDKTATHSILTVEDHAGGIDPTVMQTLFDPYVTTKTKEHGTGIGLYMSHQIIHDQMHGSLEVKNTSDGALFSIKLPL